MVDGSLKPHMHHTPQKKREIEEEEEEEKKNTCNLNHQMFEKRTVLRLSLTLPSIYKIDKHQLNQETRE